MPQLCNKFLEGKVLFVCLFWSFFVSIKVLKGATLPWLYKKKMFK